MAASSTANPENQPTNPDFYRGSSPFWETYLRGRPHLPDSFFDKIYTHHTTYGNGLFNTAHDVGAGAGIHSARLAERFKRVIVSDISEANISAAQTALAGSSSPNSTADTEYEFHASKLEDTGSIIPPSTIDLVFAGSVLHFTSTTQALYVLSQQLKPGGTLAAPIAGGFYLLESSAQTALEKVFHTGCLQMLDKHGRASLSPMLHCNARAYDGVEIPYDVFPTETVRRWKINDDKARELAGGRLYELCMPLELRDALPPVSAVGEGEAWDVEWDEELKFRKNFEEVMEALRTFPFDFEDEEMKKHVEELREVMGEREVEGWWVVSTILATRASD